MTVQKTNLYELLKTKEIIAILDGDTKYQEYEFEDGTTVPVAMPYLSGPDLCGVSTLAMLMVLGQTESPSKNTTLGFL